MGQFYPYPEDFPITDQIKTLADDELLDFWEETQFLDRILRDDVPIEGQPSQDYERLILQELQLRSCMRSLRAEAP